METTYSIIRFINGQDNITIKTGLTKEEAKEHCQDLEGSSKTCSHNPYGVDFFDGFTEE